MLFVYLIIVSSKRIHTRLIPAALLILFCSYIYILVNAPLYASPEPYKAFVYALIALLLANQFLKYDFTRRLRNLFLAYVILSLSFFALGFGVDMSAQVPRLQGFLSEPSAFGFILAYVILAESQEKQFYRLGITAFAATITFSVVVYATIFLSFALYLLARKRAAYVLLFLLAVVTGFASLIVLSNITSENWLLAKSSAAASAILSFGEEGRNTRLPRFDQFFLEQAVHTASFYIGNGPYSDIYFYRELGEISGALTFPAILFFNFGVFGMVVGLIWVASAFLRVPSIDPYKPILVCALSYSLLNSASGIVNYIYLFSMLFYAILLKRRIRVHESRPAC
jgi:hypothetical protein